MKNWLLILLVMLPTIGLCEWQTYSRSDDQGAISYEDNFAFKNGMPVTWLVYKFKIIQKDESGRFLYDTAHERVMFDCAALEMARLEQQFYLDSKKQYAIPAGELPVVMRGVFPETLDYFTLSRVCTTIKEIKK